MIALDPREPVQELVRLRAKVNLLLAMNSCAMSDRKRDLEKISRLNTESAAIFRLNTELLSFVN